MPIVDCSKDMRAYHNERVTLGKSEQQEMHERREAGRTRLTGNLEKQNRPQPAEIASQGSYAMRTMVQDDDKEYDIDDGVYFRAEDLRDFNGATFTPRQSREFVRDALKSDQRLKHEAEVKENCVRQAYPEGYHIDIPVYRSREIVGPDGAMTGVLHELASGDRWVESDARAVTKWFADIVGELNREQADGSQLRRIVRLSKKFSRRQRDWKRSTTSGICVTVLVKDCFVAVEDRDDASLLETWKAIDRLPWGCAIRHPVLNKDLAAVSDVKVSFFRACIRDALASLQVLERSSCARADALEAWDRTFNTDFFSGRPSDGNGGNGGKRPLVIAGGGAVQRDDGGRRFG